MEDKADYELIGTSSQVLRIKNAINKLARVDMPVLFIGEAGTGKESLARNIHKKSKRRKREFFVFDSFSIPDEVLDEELFGKKRRRGTLKKAENSTLYISGLERLTKDAQAKLLYVLRYKKFRKENSKKYEMCNVRFIGGTEYDFDVLISKNNINPEFLLALGKLCLLIPPLRERKEDIPHLIEYFVDKVSKELKIEAPAISLEFIQASLRTTWPGNIPQLESSVRTALLMSQKKVLEMKDLPRTVLDVEPDFLTNAYTTIKSRTMQYKALIYDIESKLINLALMENNYNQIAAADTLSLNEATLRNKMRKMGIMSSRQRLREMLKKKL